MPFLSAQDTLLTLRHLRRVFIKFLRLHVPYVLRRDADPMIEDFAGNRARIFPLVRAFTAVELKSYNAILAPLIYQNHLAAVVVKQNFFADLLQCTSIYRCAL